VKLADFHILLAISHQQSTAIESQTHGRSHHENLTYTLEMTLTGRIRRCVETVWWMATGRSWLGKWKSSLVSLTIQITTACTSNISFNSALMVYSISKAFLSCIWEGVYRVWSRWWLCIGSCWPLTTTGRQSIVNIQVDKSSSNF